MAASRLQLKLLLWEEVVVVSRSRRVAMGEEGVRVVEVGMALRRSLKVAGGTGDWRGGGFGKGVRHSFSCLKASACGVSQGQDRACVL